MISVKDSGNNLVQLKTTLVDGQHVPSHIVDSCALPTGAATEATLGNIATLLQSQAAKTDTQPVSVVSAPNTLAQDTTLQAINTKLSVLSPTGLTYFSLEVTDTSSHDLIAAGTGINFISQMTVTNQHATQGTLITISDDTTACYRVYVAAGQTVPIHFSVFTPLANTVAAKAFKVTSSQTSDVFISGIYWNA